MNASDPTLVAATAQIVAAYAGKQATRLDELPALIAAVHGALAAAMNPPAPKAEPLTPAVPVKQSVAADYIVCLETGKKFKSLKRHLAGLGLTPDDYRQRWGLPASYPMVAPGYAARRSELAREQGLGSRRRAA